MWCSRRLDTKCCGQVATERVTLVGRKEPGRLSPQLDAVVEPDSQWGHSVWQQKDLWPVWLCLEPLTLFLVSEKRRAS